MKENPDIDELLNGYIDGELSQRQHTEVQRLILHDEHLANKLNELKKYKELLGSLPCEEAPSEMLDEIKTALERNTLLEHQPFDSDGRAGVRHLLIRKVMAAAALIGLVAVLGVVVFTIIAPDAYEEPVALEAVNDPVEVVEFAKEPTDSEIFSDSISEDAGAVPVVFNGRFEIDTEDLPLALVLINAAFRKNAPTENLSWAKDDSETACTIVCSSQKLKLFFTDLQIDWDDFDAAVLTVKEKENSSEQIVVRSVTAEQAIEIISQAEYDGAIKIAKYFALANEIDESVADDSMQSDVVGSDVLVNIPKPILTSGGENAEADTGETKNDNNVRLTIVVHQTK